jgi:2-polyprenyl-6-methoxyphenol hydroxylase-like FAD-dependent oxidoreductase
MRQHQTEVLVAGAGPVGMFTALQLVKGGVQVQVVDQEARTAGHSYACALHPNSLKLLAEAGVADEAVQRGRRVNKIGFYAGGARCGELKLGDLPTPYPFVLVLEQSLLEDLLEQQLRRHGVAVEWQHRLADLTADEGGVTATIERLGSTGKGYGVPEFGLGVEKTMETRAELLVGADGNHSLTRDRLGIKYEPAGEREQFAVFELKSEGPLDDEMKVVFDRSVTSVMWPLAADKCRWSFQMVTAEAPGDFPDKDRSRLLVGGAGGEEDARQRAQRLLRERAPWFTANIREVAWRTDIQFDHRLADRFGRGRGWLAGDAAHQTGPVGMQSMNEGLREGADLALAMRKVLREHAAPATLQSYGDAHRAVWRRLLRLDGGPKQLGTAANWVKGHCNRIIECLPASGEELAALLKELGLESA